MSSSPALKLIQASLIALLSVFAPAKGMLIAAFCLILLDLITGVWAASKRKEPITSRGLRRTITKLFVYESAIMIAFLTETYLTLDIIPVAKIISSFVGVVELKSVLENINSIGGSDLLTKVISKINGPDDK